MKTTGRIVHFSLIAGITTGWLLGSTGCSFFYTPSKKKGATQPVATAAQVIATQPVVLAPEPSTQLAMTEPAPTIVTTQPVATSDLGRTPPPSGLAPKPKPFIAVPEALHVQSGRPSTLLLEHASPDSPIAITDYAKQPSYTVGAFNLRLGLSSEEVQRRMGKPAQIADTEDPWLVYRLVGEREIWLHFSGSAPDHLDAADVIRGAEDGYVRDRVFSAYDMK